VERSRSLVQAQTRDLVARLLKIAVSLKHDGADGTDRTIFKPCRQTGHENMTIWDRRDRCKPLSDGTRRGRAEHAGVINA